MIDDLRQEIESDYANTLKNLPTSHSISGHPPVIEECGENSKNSFKEAKRVIQRNLLRCHPLIHRPAIHLRSKMNNIQLNITFPYAFTLSLKFALNQFELTAETLPL